MRRRGYHQREHNRTNEQGTTFRAGQGTVLMVNQGKAVPQVRAEVLKSEPILVPPALVAPRQEHIPVKAHYRVGSEIVSFCPEEQYEKMYKEVQSGKNHELIRRITEMMFPASPNYCQVLEGAAFLEANQKDRKRMLLQRVSEYFDQESIDLKIDNLKILDNALWRFNYCDKHWEVYNPQTGKATKPMAIIPGDFMGGRLEPYRDAYRTAVHWLTKDGFAVSYQRHKNSGLDWLYALPAVPGFHRDWLYGGLVR